MKQIKLLLIVCLFSFLLIGCASFSGGKLPVVDNLPDKSNFKNKPSVYLEVNFYTDTTGTQKNPVENITAKKGFIELVEKVTKEANLFSNYTLDRLKAKEMDYTIQVEMLNYANVGTARLMGFLTGLTLYIIPSCATDNYKLTARIIDRSGKELGKYQVEDYISTWFHLFMIPFAPGRDTNTVVNDVHINMLKNLFLAICKDNILQYSWLPYKNNNIVSNK